VSDSILDHGYIPEEHAPDPVIGHGDPTPPGKVAIWMFLASEIMFFIAILGTYIILRSGSPELFKKFAGVLSKGLGATNTAILILSSLTMALAVDASQKGNRKKTIAMLGITFACAAAFMFIKLNFEYRDKWNHHTVVYRDSSSATGFSVADGHVNPDKTNDATLALHHARAMALPAHGRFDIHLVAEEDIEKGIVTDRSMTAMRQTDLPTGSAAQAEPEKAGEVEVEIPRSAIAQDINYMPWKNIFYACYFTLTGVHGVHVLGGMVPILLLMIQAMRGKLYPAHTEYVGLYWHFVDLVWIFLFPLLYLI
jgi:cytochrome c oxidase subunit III